MEKATFDEIDLLIYETFKDDNAYTLKSFSSYRAMSMHVFQILRSHIYTKDRSSEEIYRIVRDWIIRRSKFCYLLDKQYLVSISNDHVSEFVMRIDLKFKRKQKPEQDVLLAIHSNLTILIHSVALKLKIPLHMEMTFYHYVRFCIGLDLDSLDNSILENRITLLKILDTCFTSVDVRMLRCMINSQNVSFLEELKNESSLCKFSIHLYENIYLPLVNRRFLTGDNGFYEFDFMSKLPMPPFTFIEDVQFYKSDCILGNDLTLEDMLTNYIEKISDGAREEKQTSIFFR